MPSKAATKKTSEVFTDQEKAAMQSRVKEIKSGNDRESGERDVREKIADMPQPDRQIGERFCALVSAAAPDMWQRTYYGMPAFATAGKDGKTIVWFKPASKFRVRYQTIEFSADAKLDNGDIWPVSYAFTEMTPAVEKQVTALVKKAIS